MTASRILTLPLLLTLGACCTNVSTDPRQGGFAGGACGQMTGAYDARLSERERTLASLGDVERALQRRVATSRADAAAGARALDEVRVRLRSATQRSRVLDAEIAQARGMDEQKRARLRSIRSRNDALRRQLGVLIAATAGAESARLGEEAARSQVREAEPLIREIDQLDAEADRLLSGGGL